MSAPSNYLNTSPTRCTKTHHISTSGHAVEQFVEALRYKSEGRRFDSRWCHWNFSLT